jgi:hypothetical protein
MHHQQEAQRMLDAVLEKLADAGEGERPPPTALRPSQARQAPVRAVRIEGVICGKMWKMWEVVCNSR